MKALKEKKRVTVLGLGETGLAAALFLRRRGYAVFVSDSQASGALEERAAQLESEKIPFELGRHTFSRIGEGDWILISPGIPPTADVCRFLQGKRVPIVSEVEVASWFSKGRLTAVTGTSGKTTVATLLHRLFQAHGSSSIVCGNIGNPWIGELEQVTPETEVVLETSSFQLLHTYSLHPETAILLNVGLNHLDWHPRFEDYVEAKLRLFQNQTAEDFALVRRKDQESFFPHYPFRGKVIYFDDPGGENANAAVLFAVARLRGIREAKVQEVLSRFEGLEHRMERLGQIDGVEFVNDSKCTTLEALAWALDSFPDGKVILLAGGHAKGADFCLVRDRIHKKLKQAVVYGESQSLLWESWRGAAPLARAGDLNEAFEEALKAARSGDTVLLSPACASFDQFSNYRERGDRFKELVNQAIHAKK